MSKYNDIGISSQLEWPRITHLFKIGILGALITFVADMLLGWGVWISIGILWMFGGQP